MLDLDLDNGYHNISLGAFFECDPENAEIYQAFLTNLDPETQYIDLDAVVSVSMTNERITFYGPSLFQGLEEHLALQADPEGLENLVIRVANSYIPVKVDGDKFLNGNLVGKLEKIQSKKTDAETGQTSNLNIPQVSYSVPGARDYYFVVSMRTQADVTYEDILICLEDGEPVSLLLKNPNQGGSRPDWQPLINMLYDGTDEKVFEPNLEIPVIGVELRDKKAPKANTPPQYGIIYLHPDYVPAEQFSPETGEPAAFTYAYFTPTKLTQTLMRRFEFYKAKAESKDLVLKVKSYKKIGDNFSIVMSLPTKSHAALPAPTTVNVAAATLADDMNTITVPALASAD